MKIKIVAFSGSLRKGSFTTKLLKDIENYASSNIDFSIMDIAELPFFNEDLEDDLPTPVKELHNKIISADAFIFATPEYNRSYSPVIKNVIDWGSRHYGNNLWNAKPAAVIGCSPYNLGGFGAVHHLRQVLICINTYTMPQPEFYLSEISKKMNDAGEVKDETTRNKIIVFWKSFENWIANFS